MANKLYNGITTNDTNNDTKDDTQSDTQKITLRQTEILNLMRQDIHVSASVLSEKLNVSLATVKRDIASLRDRHVIVYVGSSKDGHWEVLI